MDLALSVPQIPSPGETIQAIACEMIPGGKGANQAYACGRLGGSCVFLSAVGEDEAGERLLRNLRSAGVVTDHIIRAKGMPTGSAVILVDRKGENCIIAVPGANAACDLAYLNGSRALIRQTDMVLAQLETPVPDVCACLAQARSLGKYTILNPAPVPQTALPEELYPCLDCIVPNETELERLTGHAAGSEQEVREAAELLLKKGVRNVVVTLGARGAMLVQPGNTELYRSIPVQAVDTTAAGDTFIAGMTVRLAEGYPLPDAIRFANAAAAISVTRKGAQTSIPDREEVMRVYQKQKQMNMREDLREKI